MPDGTPTTSSPSAGADATRTLHRQAAESFALVAASIGGVRSAVGVLRSSEANDAALDELVNQLTRLTTCFAEGADLFARLMENPAAFKKSPRAGLADAWSLRRDWLIVKEQFLTAVEDSRNSLRLALAGRRRVVDEVRALSPASVSPPVADEIARTWVEFLCMTTRHFAGSIRTVAAPAAAIGIPHVPVARVLPLERDFRAAAARLAASALFDAAFYVSQLPPDFTPSDPALHFVAVGWAGGRDPHPLFSTSYYLSSLPTALPDGIDPLTHYITTGSSEGRNPHPLFDTAFFAAGEVGERRDGETWLAHFLDGKGQRSPHRMFDREFYCVHASLGPASAPLALLHYLVHGWHYGLPFSPFFDVDYYRRQSSEQIGVEPWSHYVMAGAARGMNPHPLFDGRYYLASYPESDIANPILHYLASGEAEGIAPSPFFEPVYYRDTYRRGYPVSGSLAHFLLEGSGANHRPIPSFDSAGYRSLFMGTTIGEHRSSPIEHFLRHGVIDLDTTKMVRLIRQGPDPLPGSPTAAAVSADQREARPPRTERPIPSVTKVLADELKYRGYPGKSAYVPGAPHVLLVAHVAGEHLFGSERSFLDMVEAINALPANLFVVLPRNVPDYTNAIRPLCQHVCVFTYPWWRDGVTEQGSAVLLFQELIQSLEIEAVHVNTIMLRECLTAARLCNVPGITHVRELINADQALVDIIGETSEAIVAEVRRRSDWIIGNSEATARIFAKPGSTFFIPNTIDLERIDIENSVNPYERIRFGVVSSNIPKKGLLDVVELARLSASEGLSAEFLLIGPETDAVRDIKARQAAGTAPSNILFPGYAASPVEAMASLHVVINFSHFAESFGRTVLEAMGSARPVIAYEWGALPELVQHGVTGYLVPYRRPAAALPHVRELCEHPERIASLGARGRENAHHRYGSKAYAEQFRGVYRSILSGRAALPAPEGRLVRDARQVDLKRVEARPRVAYFCWHFPVPSETFVLNELEVLVRDGVDVLVFCRQSPHKNFKPPFELAWERVDGVATLARRLVETGRTIVHAHFTYPTVTDMVWPACVEAAIPFTFIAHAQDIFKFDNDRRNRLADITASPLCRRVFTLSRFHHDFLTARGVPRSKIVINPNAVNTERFAGAADVDRAPRPFRRIIAVHRYVPKKGLSLLIEAAALLRDTDVRIDLFGYGELEEEYRRRIGELGLSNVVVNGALTQDQVVDEMRRADLFACPSIRTPEGDMDGIPTSIVESMAAGVPVLATAVAGIPDLVSDGVSGILCEPDAESVAAAIRRFYAMPDDQVAGMVAVAAARAARQHDAVRLVRVLRRVWENRTVDIVVVSWNGLAHLRAVIERVRANTALPYHLIVCDNQSRKEPVGQFLDTVWEGADNVTIIHNDRNAMVGPGTNAAMAEGTSDIVIYLCGKEGFSFANGWELPFVHAFAEDERAGLVGTVGRSPTYMTGEMYPKGIPLFAKFRNQDFAAAHKDRIFGHVQGGLFGIRRAMVDQIGGFSDDVPHDYTDVEYSYYVESCGWKLAEAPGVLALFNKSRPTLSQRFDESVVVAHPVDLDQAERFDAVRAGRLRHCNICDWYGDRFGEDLACPSCGTTPPDRSVYRWLSEGPHMYRRLPALSVGLTGQLEKVWGEQFQGPRLELASFLDTLRAEGRLKNGDGALRLALIRGLPRAPSDLALLARELGRVTSPDAPVLFQFDGDAPAEAAAALDAAMAASGFTPAAPVVYTSTAVRFAHVPIRAYQRHVRTAS